MFRVQCMYYSSLRPRSNPVDEANDIRLDGRRSGPASSGFVLVGSMIALSSAYGKPRCRPRIYPVKSLEPEGNTIRATITSLLSVRN